MTAWECVLPFPGSTVLHSTREEHGQRFDAVADSEGTGALHVAP